MVKEKNGNKNGLPSLKRKGENAKVTKGFICCQRILLHTKDHITFISGYKDKLLWLSKDIMK